MLLFTHFPSKMNRGFTLVECLVGVAVIGVVFVTIYSALTGSVGSVRDSREELRATQILQEKMETIRLANWNLIRSNMIPTQFQMPYSDVLPQKGNPMYQGTVIIEPFPPGVNYSPDMRQVTLRVRWKGTGRPQTRELNTYISRHGVHPAL